MSYVDITFIEPADLAELGAIPVELADEIVQFAEAAAERLEREPPPEEAPEEEGAGRTLAATLADADAAAIETAEIPVAAESAPTDATSAESPPVGDEAPADTPIVAESHAEAPADTPIVAESPAEPTEPPPIPTEEPPPQH